ncbi:MAG TPA: DNA-3-methyladenine glycosylase 2 family protein [Stellaceae bacterium]|nr:DNA-3-methyladenine glycosylase 2 family protein [Stellaceae bacterium]
MDRALEPARAPRRRPRKHAPDGLETGARALARLDPDFARILASYGLPRFPRRPASFGTLLHIILEQQLSLDIAAKLWKRLQQRCRPLTPIRFLELDEDTLKNCGFTRQKIGYARGLASAILERRFSPSGLRRLGDEQALAAITELHGFGHWSAEVFLLFALGRPDIWPAGDLALQVAVQWLKSLPARPDSRELRVMAEAWRPWRSVAACLLWQFYLCRLNRALPAAALEGLTIP